jgi:ATP-dependent DNA helicase RecG
MTGMKENEKIEFKKSLAELKAGLVSISAILNKHGDGELWFGIRNDGKAVGLEVSEKTLRDISQAIAAHIEPRIYPCVAREKIDNADCIKIAFSGRESPYYANGRAYMRVADEDRQLSARELENLILARKRKALRWDNEVWNGSLDDLDEEKLKRFTERAGLAWDNRHNVLEKLGLIREGRPVNAAPLFFAGNSPMQLRCAVFATTDSATIIDRHDLGGDILELIEEAQKYILKNIHIGMRLKGLYREDVPEISIEALREVIINAFCHRDYRDPDYVQIAVFRNRVEIRNPGGLFGGLTFEEIRKGNVSKRRNPLVAELLRRIHMVEAWGRGMPLILKNAPDVEFREVAGIFIAGFERPSFAEEQEAAIDKTIEETTKETAKEKAAPPKETILNAIREHPGFSVKELAELCALSPHGVQYHINKLKESGMIRHVGPTKAGRWEILHDE